ncbi:alkylated DNA repair protein alkB homolog 8 isoform X2 [Anthonomus grandis grandis]|uniref:alkylated DNA repair protein alkB homolog 8 isoform X2 n=1 Tax=Anthonomus grandis grandis TaxID=2921223 RepID=UPI002165CCAC|nr:alkylated DNA repair protein alkB homolog 8 isoform X2 [Anthonomus grandis grandis]
MSLSQQKKLTKKLLKLQHILEKETGIQKSLTSTRHLAICNAGLVSGLTEDVIFEHFSKHGPIKDIIMLPGKSCCFVSYETLPSSESAYDTFNGKLNIAQDGKPIFLLYVEEVPLNGDQKVWGETPPGLIIIDNFIDECKEELLLNLCQFNSGASGEMKHRQVKHFGYEFRYDINNVDKDKPLSDPLPKETDFLWTKLGHLSPEFSTFKPDQLTINHYCPGQGIPHHIDTHSAFENPIVCLSLGSPIVMEFKNGQSHICSLLPQRSLLIMSGESRYEWTHGIVPRKFDVVRNNSGSGFTCLKRGTRVSFTFRKVLQGECKCIYKTHCDSHNKETCLDDTTASRLESLHVHKVYDSIADHFSDTRHKPWPNVLDFVQSFDCGHVIVDVGCGNGKYLSHNKKIFDVGCDYSSGLIEICNKRNFNAFIGDCLSIPIKDNFADGVISIAVIHHLATEQRRLKAIQEIFRILNVGGRALIYVWAHDQIKNDKKSRYIMQDRKNRKGADGGKNSLVNGSTDINVLNGMFSLPVHKNRTNFQAKDVLVPWKMKDENQSTFFRFYHVFHEHELENVCQKVPGLEILKSYYDQGNWCVIFRKLRMFWVLVIISSLSVSIYLTTLFWARYNDNPTRTLIESTDAPLSVIPFPAVTICNLNPAIHSKVDRFLTKLDGEEDALQTTKKVILKMMKTGTFTNGSPQNYNMTELDVAQEVLNSNGYPDLNMIVKRISQKCEDMILRCAWNKQVVNCKDIFEETYTIQGRCCSFNYIKKDSFKRTLYAIFYGLSTGLRVLLKPEYNNRSLAGVTVTIHNPEDFPGADHNEKKTLALGKVNYVELEGYKRKCSPPVRELSIEKRQCLFSDERRLDYFGKYSYYNCLFQCEALAVVEQCRCVPYYFDFIYEKAICNSKNAQCVQNITFDPFKECDCQSECEEDSYDITLASVKFINDSSVWMMNTLDGENIDTENSILLNVYFASNRHTIWLRNVITTGLYLVSSFGGIYSLFLGCSIITVIEIFYYLIGKIFIRNMCTARKIDQVKDNKITVRVYTLDGVSKKIRTPLNNTNQDPIFPFIN